MTGGPGGGRRGTLRRPRSRLAVAHRRRQIADDRIARAPSHSQAEAVAQTTIRLGEHLVVHGSEQLVPRRPATTRRREHPWRQPGTPMESDVDQLAEHRWRKPCCLREVLEVHVVDGWIADLDPFRDRSGSTARPAHARAPPADHPLPCGRCPARVSDQRGSRRAG